MLLVKLHVALARISLAATVYAYIYIFTFLNGFVFSMLQCCRVGSRSRTKINLGSQSRNWSRTEKMAESQSRSQSRTDFALTLQHSLKQGLVFFFPSVQFSLFIWRTKYKIMIAKNPHILIAAGFMRSPSCDL